MSFNKVVGVNRGKSKKLKRVNATNLAYDVFANKSFDALTLQKLVKKHKQHGHNGVHQMYNIFKHVPFGQPSLQPVSKHSVPKRGIGSDTGYTKGGAHTTTCTAKNTPDKGRKGRDPKAYRRNVYICNEELRGSVSK